MSTLMFRPHWSPARNPGRKEGLIVPMTFNGTYLQPAYAASDDQNSNGFRKGHFVWLSNTGSKCPLLTSGVTNLQPRGPASDNKSDKADFREPPCASSAREIIDENTRSATAFCVQKYS